MSHRIFCKFTKENLYIIQNSCNSLFCTGGVKNITNLKMNKKGSAVLQVLSAGNDGSPKSVYLFTDKNRYLFNCGEGIQRLAHEYKAKLSRLENIFITSSNWNNIGGLPGLSLTVQDIGLANLTIHGPPGLDELYTATQKFIVLNYMNVNVAKCEKGAFFKDSTMSVKYVPIERNNVSPITNNIQELDINDKKVEFEDNDYYGHENIIHRGRETNDKKKIRELEFQKLCSLPKKENFVTMSFICRLKDRLGMLDLQKCVTRGIKPGPMLGLLKNGQDVTLPDGTLVRACDVKNPDIPGPVFIVIDIPDDEYLDNLLKCDDFEPHQEKTATNPKDLPNIIIHFTPNRILKSDKYQTFMNSFPKSTKHLLVNGSDSCCNSISVQRIQYKLNLLDKEVFPLVKYFNDESHDNVDIQEQIKTDEDIRKANVIPAKTLTFYYFQSEGEIDRSFEVKCNPSEYIEEVFVNEGFSESLRKLHDSVNEIRQTSLQKYPMITFLGTGSCIPNKTRNTSGILIHFNENNCIIVDCGEGTYGQMVKLFGEDKIDTIMTNLKAVFISHLHADHHLGLVNILLNRKRVLSKVNNVSHKLVLFAPKQIMTWLNLYHKRFEEINDDYELISNVDLTDDYIKCNQFHKNPTIDRLLQEMNLSKIETCYVKHCANAFGISVTTDDNKKITYSGDTMPCDRLVNIGKNSDVLIHEATMEDELQDEAIKKLHSTTSQAVEMGKKMNAKFIILTHFSQRYARVPRLSGEIENSFSENNVGIAFDNMQVSYDNLRILPLFYPSLKLMFAEHCEDLENKAAKRAIKRNSSPTREEDVLKRNKTKCKSQAV